MILEHNCYLSLGSNLGARKKNIENGLMLLRSGGLELASISSLYETEPVDMEKGDFFLNLALHVITTLPPLETMDLCLTVEKKLGRSRADRNLPRTFDADIVFYDDLIIDSGKLILPHPRMHERKFVLLPLAEIAPRLIHPVLMKSVLTLLEECSDVSQVRKAYPAIRLLP